MRTYAVVGVLAASLAVAACSDSGSTAAPVTVASSSSLPVPTSTNPTETTMTSALATTTTPPATTAPPVTAPRPRGFPLSPDGRFRADTVRENGAHYRVVEVATGRVLFTTHAQFTTANDVKAGRYCGDRFLAAYHYGHAGTYTWIGAWSLEDGRDLGEVQRVPGFTTDLSGAC